MLTGEIKKQILSEIFFIKVKIEWVIGYPQNLKMIFLI